VLVTEIPAGALARSGTGEPTVLGHREVEAERLSIGESVIVPGGFPVRVPVAQARGMAVQGAKVVSVVEPFETGLGRRVGIVICLVVGEVVGGVIVALVVAVVVGAVARRSAVLERESGSGRR